MKYICIIVCAIAGILHILIKNFAIGGIYYMLCYIMMNMKIEE